MSGDKKWTRRAAIGFIGTGAGLLALETSGTLHIHSDRGVTFGTSPDDEALVVLENLMDNGFIPVIKNKFDSKAEVTLSADSVDFDVGNTGSFEPSPVSFSLQSDSSEEWVVSSDTDPESINIEFKIDGELIVDLIKDVTVSQSGQFDLGIKTKAPGGSGKLDFGIENSGSREAGITGIRVDDTTKDAVEVSQNNLSNGIFFVGGRGSGTTLISDRTLEIDATEITEFDHNQSAKISVNEEREFNFRRFRDSNEDNVNMSDAIVDITLQFGDGSLRQFELDFPEEE